MNKQNNDLAALSLGIALARSHKPQAILMDINLPGGFSGSKALKMLQGDPLTKHIAGYCHQRQRHAGRHQEGAGGGLFPLAHQTHQGR